MRVLEYRVEITERQLPVGSIEGRCKLPGIHPHHIHQAAEGHLTRIGRDVDPAQAQLPTRICFAPPDRREGADDIALHVVEVLYEEHRVVWIGNEGVMGFGAAVHARHQRQLAHRVIRVQREDHAVTERPVLAVLHR